MHTRPTQLISTALLFATLILTACGGGGAADGGATPVTTYTIGGSVSGLTGTVVLQNNGGNNLSISANGSFTFSTAVANGTVYAVTVLSQPTGQTCSVNPYSGMVSGANVGNVAVTCAAGAYTVGGNITGLTASGLQLQNNSGNTLTVASGDTAFTFSAPLADGATYLVTVSAQPSGQTCTASANTGPVSGANVNSVTISCTAGSGFSVGGNVSGLNGTVVLKKNGADNLTLSSNGNFTFTTPQASGSYITLSVSSQPATQTCSISPTFFVMPGANVTSIAVTCATKTYSIGGVISDLTASGLELLNNGGDPLTVSSGATAFTFANKIADSSVYNVSVSAQPTGLTCTAGANTDTVASANVTTVTISCSVNSYTIGGTVNNLTGSGLKLQNNGGDDLTITASGVYAFATPLASGSNYQVTVLAQPVTPNQVCSVTAASGVVGTTNVSNVDINCVSAYTIGGTIYGDASLGEGKGPILLNNGGDNLLIPILPAGGAGVGFTFNLPIANNEPYLVTQGVRASSPAQDCGTTAITNGSGNATANVINVSITCVATTVAAARFAYVTNSTINGPGVADTASAYTIAGNGALSAATTPMTASGEGPYSIAVDPTGQFAYVVNLDSDSVSAYGIQTDGSLATIDANSALAEAQLSIATGDLPISIAIHPSGKFAYVANQGNGTSGNTLSTFGINTSSGALVAIDADAATSGTQATIATGALPYAVTIDPLGKFAYVANYTDNTISAYTINEINGSLTAIDADAGILGLQNFAAGTNPSAMAIDPSGKCALVTNNTSNDVKSYSIDSSTGALTFVTTTAPITSSAPRSVAIDPNTGGYAYVANAGLDSVSAFSIALPSCTIATINADAVTPTIAAGTTPLSIHVDPAGQFVYVANFGSDTISVYSIGSAGALTWVETQATDSGPTSVTTTQ